MSNKFEVGEIAILQRCDNPIYNGTECIIERLPTPYPWRDPRDGRWVHAGHYMTAGPNGSTWSTAPFKLRKRPPPPNWTALAYSKPRDVETTEQV